MITVLLVDDHPAIRQTLQYFIEKSDDIRVMATASSGIEAVAQVSSRCPDIVVMDISMPQMDGMEATRQVLVRCPAARVLMLSTYDRSDFIRHSLEVGARGYVLKDNIVDDLVEAIRALSLGKPYFSQKIAETAEKILLEGKNSKAD